MLLLHPYRGLMQDARIYIGQALADRDPAGLGRDMLFADDAQTRFTAIRPIMRALLEVTTPDRLSAVLAFAGLLVWLGGAVALARSLVPGRMAWIAAAAMIVLPGTYGALGTFAYAESVATPRVFAEAAVLGALAALLGRRRLLGLGLLAVATALHPLMALPGLAAATLLLVNDDRRWLVPVAAAVAAGAVGTAFGLPLFDRLTVMDDTWLGILRARSTNLFPTLWPADVFGRIACHGAAALVAGLLSPPRVRAMLWGGAAVGIAGVVVSAVFGDRLPLVLVLQLQPWRALWLLAVVGNAGLGIAAVALWRGDRAARFTLAVLALAWVCQGAPALSVACAVAAVALQALASAGRPVRPSALVVRVLEFAVAFVAITVTVSDGALLRLVFSAPGAETRETLWAYLTASNILSLPLFAGAVAAAVTPAAAARRPILRLGRTLAVVGLSCAAALLWDGRSRESRMVDARDGLPALQAALGPGRGDVLWVDETSEAWFLAHRPAFFNAVQGAPILFSRDLALEWADRGRMLRALGLVRAWDLAPWGAGDAEPASPPAEGVDPTGDVRLRPEAAVRFCADRRHPAALVMPGDQMDRVPAGWTASLWRPPVALHRPAFDGFGATWAPVMAFTVVPCPLA